jgi:hypothetical protein
MLTDLLLKGRFFAGRICLQCLFRHAVRRLDYTGSHSTFPVFPFSNLAFSLVIGKFCHLMFANFKDPTRIHASSVWARDIGVIFEP